MAGTSQKTDERSVGEAAGLPGVRECCRWYTDHKSWINEQHLQICRIPAPTFFEQERAEWFLRRFQELGCEARLDGAGNVVARPRKAPQEPCVVVSAHLDTVLAPRVPEEIAVEAGGRLRGPGVSDNGAGLAALVAIAASLDASPAIEDLHCGLLLLANVCEEGEGNLSGMRHFCESSPDGRLARAFLVLDGPATDHITCSALESRRFEVSFTGTGGHSWSDFGTGNPVHGLARAIALFLDQAGAKCQPPSRSSFNFGVLEGGSNVNAIPSWARAKVDLRSETSKGVEELAAILAAAVEQGEEAENAAATGGRVVASRRLIGSRPGGSLPEKAPLLRYLKSVDGYLGLKARNNSASTDANIPLSKELQAVSIGAGGSGGGAHTAAEWFHPGARDLGLKRILLTLALLMRDAALAP
ncbi:MAG: M20/M25/M40 family metallo-hydrolase [Bryobacterales bacterium]|nr:M20/M25/M40 family metallo-hydrolase [Bryobacterales bacterium]